MSDHKKVLKIISVLSAALLISALAAACTPESPPLPPLYSGSETASSVQSSTPPETESSTEIRTERETQSRTETSTESRTENTFSGGLWDEAVGSPVTVNYKFFGEGDPVEAQTTVPWLMNSLAEAVCNMKIAEETDNFAFDSNETISFWDKDGNSFSLEFSGGTLMKDNTHYEVTGYPELKTLLNELRDNYSGENMEESFVPFTEQELGDMETVGERLKALTDNEEYHSAPIDKRRTMAVELLNELADEGLVIKESISSSEGYDTVSFRYSSGVLGGIMLKEWDPMIN